MRGIAEVFVFQQQVGQLVVNLWCFLIGRKRANQLPVPAMRFVEMRSLFIDKSAILIQRVVMPGEIGEIRLQEPCHFGRAINNVPVPILRRQRIAGREILFCFNNE